jgi:hypothetical protein
MSVYRIDVSYGYVETFEVNASSEAEALLAYEKGEAEHIETVHTSPRRTKLFVTLRQAQETK